VPDALRGLRRRTSGPARAPVSRPRPAGEPGIAALERADKIALDAR